MTLQFEALKSLSNDFQDENDGRKRQFLKQLIIQINEILFTVPKN